MSRTFRRRIDARITELQTLRDKLDACIGCGCLSMRPVRALQSNDTVSATGAGPRYLMGQRPDR